MMASLVPQKSKRFWWWNSDISSKNSKWLQENLYVMDTKVKQMFKLLEEDADSFARRAEMYYKKRPELLKLVEEFYRAYRALAERYDNATGALRQAQRTMAEAFPNQIPSSPGDDFSSPSGSDSRTPEALPIYSVSGSDDTPKVSSARRARKGLVFDDVDQNGSHNADAEMKISAMESDFVRLEAEKEAAVLKCEEMMARISSLEEERRTSKDFDQKMKDMKSTVTKLENERETFVTKCYNYESKISELEKYLSLVQNDTANFVVEASTLKEELMKMGAEKDDLARDHQQLLLSFSNAEAKLLLANDNAKKTNEEFEVASKKLLEEQQMLRREIYESSCKKDAAEEKHHLSESLIQSLNSEVAAKGQEIKVLLTSLDEEHLRYVEAETAFQILQQINSQRQNELLSVSAETQKQRRTIQDIELQNQQLQTEISKLTSEINSLNDVHLSSVMEIEELKVQNSVLTNAIKKLESEVDLRTDERNALQQDTLCLKEELSHVKKNHVGVVGGIESIGFSMDNFQSEVKNLMEDCERGKVVQDVLMERISVLEKIAQEKELLENSLTNMCVERLTMKSKIEMLEESHETLMGDNVALVDRKGQLESQLLAWKLELESVAKNNSLLENSLLESLSTIESLGMKLASLGDSCSELEDEKANLVLVKENLALQLSDHQMQLQDLNDQYEKLLKEKEKMINKVDELKASYSTEVEEHENLKIKSRNMEDSFFTMEKEKSKLETYYNGLTGQIESLGFHRATLTSSLKGLLEENALLKQTCDKGIVERSALLGLKSVLTEDKASLESQLLACNQKVENTMGKISSLENSLSESCSKIEMLEKEKLELATTKEKVSAELGTSRMQLDTLKGEYEELEKEMDSVLSEVEKLNGCYSSEVRDHENLKIKSRNLEDSFFLLEKEKSELQSNHKSFVTQVESVGLKAENLATTLKYLLEENAQLKKNCDNGNVQRSALASQLDFLSGKLESGAEKNRSLEKSLTESRSAIEVLETQLRKLGNEKQILEKEKGSLNIEVHELRARNLTETEEHQRLKMKSKSLEDSFSSLEIEKSQLLNNYTSYVTQVESVGFKPESLASSIRNLLEENTQLKENSEKCKGEISFLDSQLLLLRGKSESFIVKNGSLEMKLRSLEEEIKCVTLLKTNLVDDLEGLTGQYQELEKKNDDLEKDKLSLLNEVEKLKECYSTETEEHQTLKEKSKSLEHSFFSLETEKSELHNNYSSFVAQVESVGFEPKTLASSVKSLRESNSRLKENCDRTNSEKLSLESLLLLISEELESFVKTNGGFENHVLKSLEMLEMKLRNLTKDCDTLGKHKESLANELEELKGLYADEMEEHHNLKVKSKGLEDSLSSLETKKFELHGSYQNFVTQIESVGLKPESFCASVRNLLEENTRLKQKNAAERSALLEEKLALTNSCNDLHSEIEHAKREANDLLESRRIAVFDLKEQLTYKCCQSEIEACFLENTIRNLIGGYKEALAAIDRVSEEKKLLQSILLSILNDVGCRKWTEVDLMRNQEETRALVSSVKDDHLTAVIQNSILVSFLKETQILNGFLATSISDLEEELFAEKTLTLVMKLALAEFWKDMSADLRQSELEIEIMFRGLQESAFLSAYYEGKFVELIAASSKLEEPELSRTVPKDIVLDHVSETSSLGVRRNASEDDDQMLKLWETTNHVSTSTQGAAIHSRSNQSMNSSELSLDKLEISKTFSGTLWDANKLLERLRSDEAKLSHLTTAVHDMKVRVPDSAEHSAMRVQLEESDAAIALLAAKNRSLRRTVEENAAWFEETRVLNGDVAGDAAAAKRKRVRDEARRGSEKIGRLEMEVQRVEYILTKEKEKIMRKNTVPLRDYLYGKKRSPRLTASKRFCVCLRM